MRFPGIILLASLGPSALFGQTYAISTFAGGLPPGIQGASDGLYGPELSVALDKNGNVFFTDLNDVLRLDPKTGIVTLIAGNGTQGYSGDNGPATSAQLYGPTGVAVDSAGNVYIADSGNSVIREVSNGIITTVAGSGSYTFGGDNGPAASAGLNAPYGVAVDSDGNLYIADTFNNRIRKVVNGIINTIAGNGTQSFSGDNGPATSAELYLPQALAIASNGDIYIADTFNNRIRKVSHQIIDTIAGTGTQTFNGDNIPATTANLYLPSGIALDATGNFYIADAYNRRVRKVTAETITTVAGNGMYGFSGDNGPALDAEFGVAWAVAVDSAGTLYVADFLNDRIRKIESGTITTVAGTATPGFTGDNGPPTSAQLNLPGGVAVDSTGVYIADTANNRIRKVAGGVITTVAGNGTPGYSGDNNTATSAQLQGPEGVALDTHGNLYIADTGNNVIRKVSNGVITTVLGNGTAGAGTSELDGPSGVALDSNNNLYIADYNNNRVLELASSGPLFTLGSSSINNLNGPAAVAVDSHNHLYVADRGNNRVIEISSGFTSTVAGALLFSQLASPDGVAVDSNGNIFIADAQHNLIREVTQAGLTTIAGNGGLDFSGDGGPATSAAMYINNNYASGIAIDSTGNIYFADTGNNRIRLLTPAGSTAQTITFNALGNQVLSAASFAVGATATSGLPVAFESNTTPVCTVSGNTVTLLASGYCAITATQPGNATTYSAATPVTQGFEVTPLGQTIGFGPLNNAALGSGTIDLVAIVSSGLAANFASNSKTVCTVLGSTLTLLTVGTCSITASQGGNATYSPAASVTQSFLVTAQVQPVAAFLDQTGAPALTFNGSTSFPDAGGFLIAAPGVTQDSTGNTYVVGLDSAGGVHLNSYTYATGTWNGWQYSGGILDTTSGLTAAVDPGGIVWFTGRDIGNRFWINSWNGTSFGGWILVADGIFAPDSIPQIAIPADGSVYVIGKDIGGRIWSNSYVPTTQTFTGWVDRQAVMIGQPSATAGQDGMVYVAVRNVATNSPVYITQIPAQNAATPNTWLNGGGEIDTDPQITTQNGTVYLTALADSGSVYLLTFTESNQTYSSWTFTNGALKDETIAAANGSAFIAGRDTSNRIYWYSVTGNNWFFAGGAGMSSTALAGGKQ